MQSCPPKAKELSFTECSAISGDQKFGLKVWNSSGVFPVGLTKLVMHHKIPISIFSSVFNPESQEAICQAIKPLDIYLLPDYWTEMIGLQALSKSGKGKEAAGREKKLAYLPFVEVMDNLTAQTFLTLPLWLRRIMQELSQRSVLPLKQLTVQKQSKCSLCWKCNYWTLNQWQQLNTANRSLNLLLKQSGICDLQTEKNILKS